jgi:hypothetical protein
MSEIGKGNFTMSSVTLTILGAIGGYLLKYIVDTFLKDPSKHIVDMFFKDPRERINIHEKLIIEKRVAAHEEIIGLVGHANRGIAKTTNSEIALYPSILRDINTFDEWLEKFVTTYVKTPHLIDRDLYFKLWTFNDYIIKLNQVYLTKVREIVASSDNPERIEQEKLSAIGHVIFEDCQKLTRDILEEASKLFRTGHPITMFIPSTIRSDQYALPNDFAQLALFSRQKELREIVGL